MRRRRSNNFGKILLIGLSSIILVVLLIGFSTRKNSKQLFEDITVMNVDENAYDQWNVGEDQIEILKDLYVSDNIKKENNKVSSIDQIDLIETNGVTQFVVHASSPISNLSLDNADSILSIGFTKVSIEQVEDYSANIDGLVNSVKLSKKGKTNAIMSIELANSELEGTMTLSEDRMVVTINILGNYIHGLSIGNDKDGDYIQIETVSDPNMEVFEEKTDSTLTLCFPYTTTDLEIIASKLGDNILSILMEKSDNLLIIKFELESLPEYKVGTKGNTITIRLNKNDDVDKNAVSLSDNGLLVVKKTEGIALKNLTENADIINKQLMISFDKKIDNQGLYYAEGYGYELSTTKKKVSVSQVIKKSEAFEDIVTNNTGDGTSFIVHFENYFEYLYTEDKDYIYIKPVTPREKYDKIVVIDPGHGGEFYPGAVYNDLSEKVINLDYAMQLKKITDKQDDIKFYYLRTEDVDVSLDDRILISNGIDPDMFISMHCNANDYTYVKGTEVYYSKTLPDSDKLTGEKMAEIIYDDLATNVDSPGRGALETEDYRVVIKASVPAVLIELGYMTNDLDFEKLSDSKFLENAADSLYNSILKVYETYDAR